MAPTERERQTRYWLAFGLWLKQRLAEQQPDKWTQDRLVGELAAIGIQVKRPWISQVSNGAVPSDDLRRGIERLLGQFPEPEPSGSADQSALIEALTAQTQAINSLVLELRGLALGAVRLGEQQSNGGQG